MPRPHLMHGHETIEARCGLGTRLVPGTHVRHREGVGVWARDYKLCAYIVKKMSGSGWDEDYRPIRARSLEDLREDDGVSKRGESHCSTCCEWSRGPPSGWPARLAASDSRAVQQRSTPITGWRPPGLLCH